MKKWLEFIYKGQRAVVVMDEHKTRKIVIGRGVRQGCPLSPLIFNLALEPLAIAIRAYKAGEGIQIKNNVIKLEMYTDDVICYLGDPTHQ